MANVNRSTIVVALLLGLSLSVMAAIPPPTVSGTLHGYGLNLDGLPVYARGGSGGLVLAVGSTVTGALVLPQAESGCGGGADGAVGATSVGSSDPSVLRVKSGSPGGLVIETVGEGHADVLLFGDGAVVVDRFPLQVKAVTSVKESLAGGVVLLEGSPLYDNVLAKSGEDEVFGPAPVQATLSGALFALPSLESVPERGAQTFWFSGHAGEGRLTLSAPGGFHVEHDLKVVAASDIASIEVTAAAEVASATTLSAVAHLADGRTVLGPRCAWSADAPGAVFSTDSNPLVTRIERDHASVKLPSKGDWLLQCTIGKAVGTVVVTHP